MNRKINLPICTTSILNDRQYAAIL